MTRDIGEFILVAHGVIEEFDATAFGDSGQSVSGGNAVKVCATACAAGTGMRITDGSIARGGREKSERPLNIATDEWEGKGQVEKEGDSQEDANRGEHVGWIVLKICSDCRAWVGFQTVADVVAGGERESGKV